jgi:hypothetical protein
MKKAMLQERERALQLQIVEGDLELEEVGAPLLCTLSPLTKKILQGLLFQKDEFPYDLLTTG